MVNLDQHDTISQHNISPAYLFLELSVDNAGLGFGRPLESKFLCFIQDFLFGTNDINNMRIQGFLGIEAVTLNHHVAESVWVKLAAKQSRHTRGQGRR